MTNVWRHLDSDRSNTISMIIMLLGCCTQGLLSDCPRLCECKWKGGKEAVSCIDADYTALPSGLEVGTQLLDLSGNNLVRLQSDDFFKAGLLNLQKVYLAKCRLKLIDRNAFRHLINLVELDLSYNLLHGVPSYIFHTMPELRELKLSGNQIDKISNGMFSDVPKLVRLEMSNCKLQKIEEKAFEGIEKSLQWLKLDNNQLTNVKASTFTLIEKMHGLELAENPWNCTCALRPFREWMISNNIPFEILPTCKYPKRLAQKSWKNLEIDDFACMPKIRAIDSKVHGIEGKDVTITCSINGVPEPNIRWVLKNRIIANQTSVSFSSGKKQYVVHMQKNSSNLTIQTADMQDAGVYICSAENKAGKVEASVTLAVSKKPLEDVSHKKAIVIGIVVAVIFVSVVTLLIVCLLSVYRRRQTALWHGRRTTNGRRIEDNYEKIEMSKLSTEDSQNAVPVVSVAGTIPILGPMKRNGDYRVVPSLDTDQEIEDFEENYEDNINIPLNANKKNDTKLWSTAGRNLSSPSGGHWNSNLNDNNLDPNDLHIPRRTLEETRDACNKTQSSTYGTYNKNESNMSDLNRSALTTTLTSSIPQTIPSHIMKKQILSNNGSLYTSVPFSSEMEKLVQNDVQHFPKNTPSSSSLEPNDNENFSRNDNYYCTLPRSKIHNSKKKTRFHSCDSQSPLLPGSRFGSSGENSNCGSRISTRRCSEDSIYHTNRLYTNQKSNSYLNLTYTNQQYNSNKISNDISSINSNLIQTGEMENHLDNQFLESSNIQASCCSPFDSRRSTLELFLEGYLNVNNQLNNMKEICDTLKQNQGYEKQFHSDTLQNLSFDYQEDNLKSILKKPGSSSNLYSPSLATNFHNDNDSSSSVSSLDYSKFTNQFDEKKRFY